MNYKSLSALYGSLGVSNIRMPQPLQQELGSANGQSNGPRYSASVLLISSEGTS